ncbi:GNAT family N-acetyltransferase [Paenibacillus dauci]|uniref:GNAT family N-acetyltransferase n=1 Tax=Paenibacillus dauci TaxID=1567106 RepID=UPI0006190D5F|nr:GNAT family N-acetyltransferase [Paenibacillus dauci]
MIIEERAYHIKGLDYIIRSAKTEDAATMSEVRLQIDGETENLDRRRGEAFLEPEAFEQLIRNDSEKETNLFLVAETANQIVGFSRCEGSPLSRLAHKVEFGVGVLRDYWGHGIGKHLLEQSISWSDATGIQKMTLNVLETNVNAIELYKKAGFEIEGVLKRDRLLADGNYYNTIVMGRFRV